MNLVKFFLYFSERKISVNPYNFSTSVSKPPNFFSSSYNIHEFTFINHLGPSVYKLGHLAKKWGHNDFVHHHLPFIPPKREEKRKRKTPTPAVN